MNIPFSTPEEAIAHFGITTDEADFKRIEDIRTSLRASGRVLSYKDYGAGQPQMQLSAEQMHEGRMVEKALNEVCGWGMKGAWAAFMYGMTGYYKPAKVLELGTCCGFSSAYMALGNPQSSIVTIEGAPEISAVAAEVHKTLDISNIERVVGRFSDVLGDVLSKQGHFDLVFIDGHHAYEPTVNYFRTIKPYAAGAHIIFDDISWSDGMKQAWREIISDSSVSCYMDMGKAGLIITGCKED